MQCRGSIDEYLKTDDTTSLEMMKAFVESVIAVFVGQHLRFPIADDAKSLLRIGENQGFHGKLGPIHSRGDQKVPTI